MGRNAGQRLAKPSNRIWRTRHLTVLAGACVVIIGVGFVLTRSGPNRAAAKALSGLTPAAGAAGASTTIEPPPLRSSDKATPVCEARLAQFVGVANPMNVSLVAAYDATAKDVATYEERRNGAGYRSSFRDRQPDEFEAVCFFDAPAFGAVAAQKSRADSKATVHDRIQEVVRPDGVVVGIAATRKAMLTPAPIPAAGAGG